MLGEMIKRTRIAQQKTIKEVAGQAEVTISLLSQIENNKTNPSINSLIAIAKALNVPVGSFFDDIDSMSFEPVVRAYKRKAMQSLNGVTYYLLTPTTKDVLVEFKYNVYEKGGASANFHTHKGQEYGIVLEGRLKVTYGEDVYILEAGDSMLLDSTIPHDMENIYDGRTITIWAACPPLPSYL
ncbi:hypothetical protein CSA56_13545 [candidate division KSB3 bacterium]|uniref:HTH cro/C1-type domain-containing protein n=1 Tax=candidate division KSB3 bacterium TaxID=2044937 RepID=A0A2G6KBA9_9BACT|nr:MAG: hypothetical protein CSA56_13545 [candidate division KSB3 bacterium]